MEVAGANRRWRLPFPCRGSRHESAVAQLSTLGVVHMHEDLYTQTSRCGAYDSRSGGWAAALFRRCAADVFGAVTDILFGVWVCHSFGIQDALAFASTDCSRDYRIGSICDSKT